MNRPPPQRGGFSDAIRHRGNGTEAIPYNRKKSPTLRWGISHKNCSSLYAERKLATSRAVLLDFHRAKSIRHEFARWGSLQKSPDSGESGDFVIFR